MKTTIWLRDARERFGGGVPSSGRSASLAVFGTIGCGGPPRRPNSPLPAEFTLISPQFRMPDRLSPKSQAGSLSPNMAKLTADRRIQPL